MPLLIPSVRECPWPYLDSKHLNPPRQQGFSYLKQRIRRFDLDSVLSMGAKILWHTWLHKDALQNRQGGLDEGHLVVRAYAREVILVALAFSSTCFRPSIDEGDFRRLCWEFHNLINFDPDSWLDSGDIDRICLEIAGNSQKNSLIKADWIKRDASWICAQAMVFRLFATQFDRFTIQKHEWTRNLSIYNHFLKVVFEKIGKHSEKTVQLHFEQFKSKVESAFLTISSERFWATWLLLLGHALQKDVPQHGRINLSLQSNLVGVDLQLRANLADDDLRTVARAFSTSLAEFRKRGDEFVDAEISDEELANLDWFDRFGSKPLVASSRYEESDEFGIFFIPCPYAFGKALECILFYDLIQTLKTSAFPLMRKERSTEPNEIPAEYESYRGEAFANYMRETVRFYKTCDPERLVNLIDLDDSVVSPQLADRFKRPDFLWTANGYGLLFEMKATVRPNQDRSMHSPSSLIIAWHRLTEALMQAQEFLDANRNFLERMQVDKWILLVVTHFTRRASQSFRLF